MRLPTVQSRKSRVVGKPGGMNDGSKEDYREAKRLWQNPMLKKKSSWTRLSWQHWQGQASWIECGVRLGSGLPHGILSLEGPVPHIPLEQVIKAIKLMKCSKVAGTSFIVAEYLKAYWIEGGGGGSGDSWSNRGYHPFWRSLLNGRKVPSFSSKPHSLHASYMKS